MLHYRFKLLGLFAVLLALMAQLGAGVTIPPVDPVAGVSALCHTADSSDGVPAKAPAHPLDCPVCPLCIALHASPVALVPVATVAMPLAAEVVLRPELPPPSTAPPAPHRPPSQPRAPPTAS